MIEDFADKRVTVLGLGHFGGGVAVSRWLAEQGASVVVYDQSLAEKLSDSVAQLRDLPITFRLGADRNEKELIDADLIVASPAIPPHHPILQAARAAHIPVTTEICLFAERCPAKIFGVTGTKGKSTTSTLLHRMLSAGSGPDRTVWFGGNIGKSLLADLPDIKADDWVVLELSSFMLEHLGEIGWSPHVAVVTMVSTDHLDWHGSQSKYIEAKLNIVRHQRAGDFAVLSEAHSDFERSAKTGGATIVRIATEPPFTLQLAGEHNQFNAQAAFAAASLFGIDRATAQNAIGHFAGLPHRLELVHEAGCVKFINDSISTIPQAAVAALGSFPTDRVIQIVGGSGKKDLPIGDLCAALRQRAKAVLCIGETGDRLAEKLAGTDGPAKVHVCRTLAAAVEQARSFAASGDIVLLSPGHPSYDQFTNFEARGVEFTRLAKALFPT